MVQTETSQQTLEGSIMIDQLPERWKSSLKRTEISGNKFLQWKMFHIGDFLHVSPSYYKSCLHHCKAFEQQSDYLEETGFHLFREKVFPGHVLCSVLRIVSLNLC